MTYQRTWENRRKAGRSVSDESRTSYYGLPVIKKPHWQWLIIWYFFLGGISASTYIIASIAAWVGGREGQRIAQVGRYISFAALLPSPVLLILDLGRPERFLHMLRVLKLRSPMSLGTWGLTAFGGLCGLTVAIQAANDRLLGWAPLVVRLLRMLPSSVIHAIGTVFAFFVGGYTGILLAATAVPVWAKNRFLMGPLFLTSALSSGVAAITLALSILSTTSHEARHRLERLERVVLVCELGLLLAVWRNSGAVIGRPFREGHLGRVFRWGIVGAGIGAPLTLPLLLGRRSSRFLSACVAVLTLTGGFLLRYVFTMAGRVSADDAEATFVFTRKKK